MHGTGGHLGDRVANGQVLAYSDDGEGTGSDTLRETTLRFGGPEFPWRERPAHSQRHQGERNDAYTRDTTKATDNRVHRRLDKH